MRLREKEVGLIRARTLGSCTYAEMAELGPTRKPGIIFEAN